MAKAKEARKVPVTERALLARINRRLAKENEQMRVCSEGSRWFYDIGRYYVINVRINGITAKHCDLEAWAQELGCLKPYEELHC